MKKDIYQIEQDWFDLSEYRISGDMAHTFQELAETRTFTKKDALLAISNQLNEESAESEDNKLIRILILQRAYVDLDYCEDASDPTTLDEWEVQYPENIGAYVFCSYEYADDMGIVDILREQYNDCNIVFQDGTALLLIRKRETMSAELYDLTK